MKTIITNVANVPPALNPDHQDKMFMKGSIYRLTESGGCMTLASTWNEDNNYI